MPPSADRNARLRILDAAEAVSLRDGVRHLTLDAAAREAGVSKGGVLYHFPNKQALLDGMLGRFVGMILEEIEALRGRFRGRPNPTLRAINATMRTRLEGPDSVRIALIAAHAENPAAIATLRDVFATQWAVIEAETSDPDGALAIWCAIEGLQFLTLFGVCPVPAQGRADLADRIDAMIDALPAANGATR